ncbi:aminotransferase class IV [Plantactinospora sp. KBS50]|uniref:aminotransferase class IV n=1 Tax=Plantactinospora sp. KBS50 TaxID=2024580 RepID=UPI0018E053F1|nr:aminotransferase class IV [Plantactinospora sp. KBS50]
MVLVWRAASGWWRAGPAPVRLLVADSWLLQQGRVRGLDLHRQRFRAACERAAGVPPEAVDRFWACLVDRLPRTGDWFPRAELVAAAARRGNGRRLQLRLRIRPAPVRGDAVRVWTPAPQDPRLSPRIKGPDLDLLADLRARAVAAGADEVLLRTRFGYALEGATASMLWWEGGTLCLPDPALRLLPGVTAALLGQAAADRDIPVRRVRRRLAALAGREVWFVNALHGIRPVVAWVGSDLRPGPAVHAAQWRDWWDDRAEPLPGSPATALPPAGVDVPAR